MQVGVDSKAVADAWQRIEKKHGDKLAALFVSVDESKGKALAFAGAAAVLRLFGLGRRLFGSSSLGDNTRPKPKDLQVLQKLALIGVQGAIAMMVFVPAAYFPAAARRATTDMLLERHALSPRPIPTDHLFRLVAATCIHAYVVHRCARSHISQAACQRVGQLCLDAAGRQGRRQAHTGTGPGR